MSAKTSTEKTMYGIVDETFFTLSHPRVCDEVDDGVSSVEDATIQAIKEGFTRFAVVKAVWSERHNTYVEGQLLATVGIESHQD